jgi:hypothetical protein
MDLAVGAYKGIKDCEDVSTVLNHAMENIAELRFAFGFAVPLEKNGLRNFDIPTQLIGGMATQKETVEKSRLALREGEVVDDFGGNELWHRGHREKGSLPKRASASSRTTVYLPRSG